jgi:opacity protein-like surface antigen
MVLMFNKTLMGVVVISMCCSLALAAESGFKVSGGLDFGVVEELVVENPDGSDFIDSGTLSFIPNLTVSKQFTEELSVSLRFSAAVGLSDDDADYNDCRGCGTVRADASFLEIKLGGLCDYKFEINEKFSVTAIAGLSWQSLQVDVDPDFYVDSEYKSSMLVLDVGAKAALQLNQGFALTGQVMLGLPVVGSSEKDIASGDADLDGGFIYEVGGGLEYVLADKLVLYAGLAYRTEKANWDTETSGPDIESQLTRFSVRVGASFSF